MVAKSEAPVENGDGLFHYVNIYIYWVSTILLVMQDFATIHSMIEKDWRMSNCLYFQLDGNVISKLLCYVYVVG